MHAGRATKIVGLATLLLGCGNHATSETDGVTAVGGSNERSALGQGGAATTSLEPSGGARDAPNSAIATSAALGGSTSQNLSAAKTRSTSGDSSSFVGSSQSADSAGAGGGRGSLVTSSGGTAGGRRSSAPRPSGGSGGTAPSEAKSTAAMGTGAKPSTPVAMGGSSGVSSGAKGGAASTSATPEGTGGCLDGPEAVVPEGYELVWADEFNVEGKPDSSNWGYESGFVRNEEAQWYQPDNARVEKGCLVIEGRRERKANPNYKAGSNDWKTSRQYADYTSSSLRTMGKRTWQYGRFEMRGRIVAQTGLWPAWWTLGESKEWPSCGEIDIMEYYAGAIRGNVACGTATRWQAKWDGAAVQVSTLAKNWDAQFHVWQMVWDDQKIELLLDDKQINTTKLSDMLNSDGSSPFEQPHYMLVNLAIGGQNGGDPAKTAFPSRLEVDYIRVYQKR